jgi:biotin carboxyl carrier protein
MMRKALYKTKMKELLMVLVFLSFSACSSIVESEKTEPQPSTPVTLTSVRYESMNDYVELNATSVFQKKNIIRSTTTGIVQMIGISLGDNVTVGEQLFAIVTKEAAALKNKTMMSDTSFHFKGEIKIKASRSGIVNTITHQQGDYVQEGDELATIAEQKSLVFLLQAPFEMSSYTKPGSSCKIALPDNKVIDGVIGSILPSMDIQSQTMTLVVKPLSSDYLPENLIAKMRIPKNSKKRSCILPEAAIVSNETQTSFWVMKLLNDSIAIKVVVKKGIETNGLIEIEEPAFLETDRIVLTGNYGLEDTAKVTISK